MSFMNNSLSISALLRIRSIKSFAQTFLLDTRAGQKLFLYNEEIPRVINISFNEKTCMFSCRMCPFAEDEVRSHYKNKSEMDFETLKRLVDSVPNDPFFSFDMSSIGETLEFEPLSEFVKYMKTKKPLVNTIISTNGVLINPDKFNALADSGLDNIQFSLYAENASDHAHITQTKNFDRVKANVLSVCNERKRRSLTKPFLQAFMIECKENSHTSQRFLDFWGDHVDKAFLRPIYNLGREIEGMTPNFPKVDKGERYPCIMPWYSTAVRSNGDVLPCYMFHWSSEGWDHAVGNINDASLKEIWASDEYQKFRSCHRRLELDGYPICQRCDLWSAYTNVWKRQGPEYVYDPVKVIDFLTPAGEYRGG